MAAERTPIATQAPVVQRLEYIDGLRALAALWVAAHHAVEMSEPQQALSSPLWRPIVGTLFFGQASVMVFLMLSGFCLFFPYVKKNPEQPRFDDFGVYVRRRFRRIAPPYFAAIALCLMFSAIPGVLVGRWSLTAPVSLSVLLTHLTFLHNLIPSHAFKIDFPMWSIGLEWQLYMFFPLMIWGFAKRGALTTIGACLAVAVVVRAAYRHVPFGLGPVLRDGPLAYLMIFGAGMFAASLTVKRGTPAPRWLLWSVLGAGLATVRLGSGNGLVHDLAITAAAFCLLLLATTPESRVARALSHPWLVAVGVFSYSLYLVHAPLLHASWLGLRVLQLSPDLTFALLIAIGMPLVIVAAYAFHRAFERPFMRTKPRPALPIMAVAADQVMPVPGTTHSDG